MTLATKAFLEKAYLAYFGRPVDPTGLTDYQNSTETQVADAFAASAESKALYGTTFNYAQINAIYLALFNREAEKAGLEYWYAKVADKTFTPAGAAIAILNGALNADKIAIENKLVASAAFTAALDTGPEMIGYSGDAAAASARSFISGVTATAATAAAVDAAVVAVVAAKTAVPAQTFTLTTSADTFTGTAGAETFNSSDATLTVLDSIDGGAGTADRLNYTDTSNAGGLAATAISGIELFYIRNVETANAGETYDFAGITGETQVWSDRSTDTATFDNLATGTTVGLNGDGSAILGAVTFQMATASAAVNIAINGGVGASGTAPAITESGSNGTATTATITSTGAANTVGTVDLAAASLTAVTINATTNLKGDFLSQNTDQVGTDGAVTISGAATTVELTAALDNTIKTINASGLTSGGIIAALGTLVTQTVTGGAGNDRIKTGAVLTTGSVNAGVGTDTLEVGDATHLANSTLGAKYTNFETLRVNDSQDMSVISGITALEVNAMTDKSVTQLTATQAANVKVLADQTTGVTFSLASSTGTADVLSITAGTGLTTAAATNLVILTANGFETINLTTNAGPTSSVGAARTTTVASFAADKVATVNLAGTAVVLTNAATTLASTINASALTGDGDTTSLGLTIGSTTFVAGSTVTGSSFVDNVTIAAGTEGVTLNLGAGNDLVTANVASLVADGTTDGAINGGDGTDTLTVSDTASATMTDNHFTKLSNMEKLTLATTGATSLTIGTAFNVAHPNGVTITQASKADGSATTYALGLSTVNTTIALTTAENGSDTTATNITTGSGADNVTVTAASYIGAAVALDFTISTGAGVDTITFSTGTLANQNATARAVTITAGTGADIISESSVNGNDAEMNTMYVVAAGDSLTTAWDQITGFTTSNGTFFSDGLNFGGATASAIGTLGTSADFGTILTHTITAGVAKFDTASVYATERAISSSNIADVVGYLAANTATNDVIAFAYDRDGNGSSESTDAVSNLATPAVMV